MYRPFAASERRVSVKKPRKRQCVRHLHTRLHPLQRCRATSIEGRRTKLRAVKGVYIYIREQALRVLLFSASAAGNYRALPAASATFLVATPLSASLPPSFMYAKLFFSRCTRAGIPLLSPHPKPFSNPIARGKKKIHADSLL